MDGLDSEEEADNNSDIYSDDEIMDLVDIRNRPRPRRRTSPKPRSTGQRTQLCTGGPLVGLQGEPMPSTSSHDWAEIIGSATIVILGKGDEVLPVEAGQRQPPENTPAGNLSIAVVLNPNDNAEDEPDENEDDPDYNVGDDADYNVSDDDPDSNVDDPEENVDDPDANVDDPEENVDDPNENVAQVRKRKRKPDPKEWKKLKNKKQRMTGVAYLGFSKVDGKVKQDVQRPAKLIGPRCSSTFCLKSKLRFCSNFSEDVRNEIFNKFWTQMNWDQRKIFVAAHVDYRVTGKATTEVPDESRRKGSYFYSLHNGADKLNVCKLMFMNTLALGQWTMHNWAQAEHAIVPSAEVTNQTINNERAIRQQGTVNSKRVFAEEFLNSLATLPSHYCRRDSGKLYLEPGMFRNHQALMNEYERKCVADNETPVSRTTFREIVREKNLEIFTPKKDQCDTCCQHQVGNLNDGEYEAHIQRKIEARLQKDEDKANAINNECHTLTMDLQAVKLSPCMHASALYYKTKLCVHNFTMYDLATKQTTNFWWSESESELVASAFASCVIDYLRDKYDDGLPIIIYSDGCTYQNRNAIMANALLHLSIEKNVVIMQKYLEKGHTQMECDSVHASIERKLKNRDIYLPTDYVAVSNEARLRKGNVGPYETKYLSHEFFKDYSQKNTMMYDSIRPGRVAKDPVVTDIRVIRYRPIGIIDVKLSMTGDWLELPRRPKILRNNAVFQPLYNEQPKIPERKWDHLQQLKSVLPAYCHAFYDNLPKV